MMDCHDSPASWAPVTTSLGSKMMIRGTGSSMAYRMGRNCPRKKPVQGRSLYTKGRRRQWLYRKPLRPFGYRLLERSRGAARGLP
jgi:hypothetical protein